MQWKTWWDGLDSVEVPGINGVLSTMVSLAWWGWMARAEKAEVPLVCWADMVSVVTESFQDMTKKQRRSSKQTSDEYTLLFICFAAMY